MAATRQERIALALAALHEVTDAADVGEVLAVEEVEPGVVDVRFASTMSAYSGWHWTVSTADLPDQEPTVLEVELVPGDGALLAPPWVPWAERLAEWRRQHPDERHPGEATDEESDEDDDADEDDLAVDDGLDELDDADLEGEESPEEAEQDSGDLSDEDESDAAAEGDTDDRADEDDSDDDSDDDDRVRPALEDRSL